MQKKMIQVFGWVIAILIGAGAVTEAVDSTIYYNNGNFGIGTTNPLSPLHVAGPAGQNAMRITSPYGNSLLSSGLIIDIDSGYGTSSRDNFGLKISATNNNDGGARSTYGLIIENVGKASAGGTKPLSSYGIYINNVDNYSSDQTNRWAIYSAPNVPSYFGGNVGIGTPSPVNLLHIFSTSNGNGVNLQKSSDSSWTAYKLLNSVGTPLGYFGVGTSTGGGMWSSGPANAIGIVTDGKSPIVLAPTGEMSKALVVSANGNVGVGMSKPTQKLEVAGTVSANRFVGDGSGLKNLPTSIAGSGTLDLQNNRMMVSFKERLNTTATDTSLKLMGSLKGSIDASIPYAVGAKFFEIGGIHHNGQVAPVDFNAGSVALVVSSTGSGNRYSSSLVFSATGDSFGNNGVGGEASEKMRIAGNGNVGIGTSTPQTPLDINGSLRASNIGVATLPDSGFGSGFACVTLGTYGSGIYGSNGQPQVTMYANGYYSGGWKYKTTNSFAGYDMSGGAFTWTTAPSGTAGNSITLSEKMRLTNGGNLGIGTTNPQAKLDVAGSIKSSDIVLATSTWADYVFEPNYNLKPLSEVAAFVKANKHLSDVPSEEEVKKNGVSVGQMNVALLRKVEELTLYVIELEKKNQEQDQQIKDIRAELNSLRNSK